MLTINVPEDCGNAPNKRLLKDWFVHLVEGNLKDALLMLDEKVTVRVFGYWETKDKQSLQKQLASFQHNPFIEASIHTIITHGRDAALNGEIIDEDQTEFHVCLFFTLSMGRKRLIKTIDAYVMKISSYEVS